MKLSQGRFSIMILTVIFVLAFALVIADPDPSGTILTKGPSSRGTNGTSPQNATAQAGNVTALNMDQTLLTGVWQGFYGNVTGGIVLENAAGNNFYDWTIANMSGEVYGTRGLVADWGTINCTNSTHWETEESALNIGTSDSDGINETFSSTSHPAFNVGSRLMSGCRSTRAYNSSGVSGLFWNVLLNVNSTNVVYTSIISNDANAFEGGTADFEILVPTNKTTALATYFFYAELNS